jgi:hypothetical protein
VLVYFLWYNKNLSGDNMTKIEINDLNSLIKKKYPPEYIKKIIDDVLILSMSVKNDYPGYKQWYLSKHIPGLYDDCRNIIVAHIGLKIVGFVNLKRDLTEKKICTFYVAKTFRSNMIGNILAQRAIEWLECDKPLITIPADKLGAFIKISKKYNWVVTDIKDGLYRVNNPEIILNNSLKEVSIVTNDVKTKTKTLTQIWLYYKYTRVIDIATFKNIRYITN